MTIVHRPDDARIVHRQLAALRDAGWDITYVAPWQDTGVRPAAWHRAVDVPRATGRDRGRAVAAARRILRAAGPDHDVVLLHDPELLLASVGLDLPPVVWDVHEDTAASLTDRDWVPSWARPALRAAVHLVERWAERRCARLLLAETGYQARFRRPHPVVPNVPVVPDEVPPPGTDRVVYVGRISRSRGLTELLELGRRLRDTVAVELIGYVDDEDAATLAAGVEAGDVTWHGYLPNDAALARVRGAAFGLSLLHDEPNYRHSVPTKVLEYLANGVPVITTPLPEAVAILERQGLGTVVPFGDVDEVERVVRQGITDAQALREAGARAHAAAGRERTWTREGPRFVQIMAAAAGH